MKRRAFMLLGLLALALPTIAFLAGCKATPKVQVGIVLPTKDEPRWIQDETRFHDALKTAGFTTVRSCSARATPRRKTPTSNP